MYMTSDWSVSIRLSIGAMSFGNYGTGNEGHYRGDHRRMLPCAGGLLSIKRNLKLRLLCAVLSLLFLSGAAGAMGAWNKKKTAAAETYNTWAIFNDPSQHRVGLLHSSKVHLSNFPLLMGTLINYQLDDKHTKLDNIYAFIF